MVENMSFKINTNRGLLPQSIISKNIQLAHQTLNNNVLYAVQDILDLRYITNPFGTRSESKKFLSKHLELLSLALSTSNTKQLLIELQNSFKGRDLASSRLTKVNKTFIIYTTHSYNCCKSISQGLVAPLLKIADMYS